MSFFQKRWAFILLMYLGIIFLLFRQLSDIDWKVVLVLIIVAVFFLIGVIIFNNPPIATLKVDGYSVEYDLHHKRRGVFNIYRSKESVHGLVYAVKVKCEQPCIFEHDQGDDTQAMIPASLWIEETNFRFMMSKQIENTGSPQISGIRYFGTFVEKRDDLFWAGGVLLVRYEIRRDGGRRKKPKMLPSRQERKWWQILPSPIPSPHPIRVLLSRAP